MKERSGTTQAACLTTDGSGATAARCAASSISSCELLCTQLMRAFPRARVFVYMLMCKKMTVCIRYPVIDPSSGSRPSVSLARIFAEAINISSSGGGGSSSSSSTIKPVSDRRSNSYSQLLLRPPLRLQLQLFLSRVFNVTSPAALYSQILAAVYHKDNAQNDLAIYKHLMSHTQSSSPVGALMSQWKKVSQLREQKVEFRDEVARLMGRLGVIGLVKDYVAVGDNGKMVLELNSSCGVNGNVWTVDPPEPFELTIESAVNRCVLFLCLL